MRNIKTRDGFEFWDKLNALPRYAFLLSPSGKSVQKFEDQAMGNWVDVHEAQQIIDQAEERISERQDELGEVSRQLEKFRSRSHGIKNLSAIEARDDQIDAASLKINALQQHLTAADERVDVLEGLLRLSRQFVVNGIDLGYIRMPEANTPDPAHDLVPKIDAALKPAEGGVYDEMTDADWQLKDDMDRYEDEKDRA